MPSLVTYILLLYPYCYCYLLHFLDLNFAYGFTVPSSTAFLSSSPLWQHQQQEFQTFLTTTTVHQHQHQRQQQRKQRHQRQRHQRLSLSSSNRFGRGSSTSLSSSSLSSLFSSSPSFSSPLDTAFASVAKKYLKLSPTSSSSTLTTTTGSIIETNGDVNDDVNRNNNSNNREVLQCLFILGRDYVFPNDDNSPSVISSEFTRVPGCVADVTVRVRLVPIQSSGDKPNINAKKQQYQIVLDGTSDAYVSRGLLVLLSKVFSYSEENVDPHGEMGETVTVDHLLESFRNNDDDFDTQGGEGDKIRNVADRFGLGNILGRGRNDGLVSMMDIILDLINQLLLNTEININVGSSSSLEGVVVENNEETEQKMKEHVLNNKNDTNSNDNKSVPTKGRVAMLLSGGVDSAVALNLLLREGYDVTAFYIKIWLEDIEDDIFVVDDDGEKENNNKNNFQSLPFLENDSSSSNTIMNSSGGGLSECPWEDEYRSCIEVCTQASSTTSSVVNLETIDLRHEYSDRILSYVLEEAKKGRTPNPDVVCNGRIKFGCFVDALKNGSDVWGTFDKIASGHYARVVEVPVLEDDDDDNDTTKIKTRMELRRSPDPIKDQTYFLSTLKQNQLQNVLFPVGSYPKSEVRQLAYEFNLPNANRPDSQGLCFLGKIKFDDFLKSRLGVRPGNIVDCASGQVVGCHDGVWFHTVGQRKGIGLKLIPIYSSRGPWYVVAKDPKKDIVFVSNRYHDDGTSDEDGDENDGNSSVSDSNNISAAIASSRSEFRLENIRWMAGKPPREVVEANDEWIILDMKVRHGPTIVKGRLRINEDTISNAADVVPYASGGEVRLEKKDGGLAPGQFVVFYEPTTAMNNKDDECNDNNSYNDDDGRKEDSRCLGCGVISEMHWETFLAKVGNAAK